MMSLFVANLEFSETDGIYKKVNAQASALSNVYDSCSLISMKAGNTKVISYTKGNESDKKSEYNINILDYVLETLQGQYVRLIYIRHMCPSVKLLSVLDKAQRRGTRIVYEIPTYPYYGEQYKASRCKPRTLVRLILDTIFWPLIYRKVDRITVIKSNTNVRLYNKMFEITNGIKGELIAEKSYDCEKDNKVFRMVAVGTLYAYHGYDRIISGMSQCGEHVDDTKIEFHVIGKSKTIDELEKSARVLGLKNVYFHGMKTTDELNQMYDKFDIGLGCLSLSRRNADIDTTLKIIEYYCRGVPVVTSGKTPIKYGTKGDESSFTIRVPDNNEAIDISKLYYEYLKLNREELLKLSSIAKNQFDWSRVMKKCVEDFI